jgi:polyisoprenoid-binding protein YceI
MEGKFKKFDATVDFDPAKLATSAAKVEIDVSSFEIGDAETTKEVKGANGSTLRNFRRPCSSPPASRLALRASMTWPAS